MRNRAFCWMGDSRRRNSLYTKRRSLKGTVRRKLLGWLPLWLGGDAFNATLFSYNLLRVVRFLLTIALVGLVSSAYLSILLLPPRPVRYGKWKYVIMVFQWFLVLITLIVFGAFPAIESQTRLMLGRYMGFWYTPKHRKE